MSKTIAAWFVVVWFDSVAGYEDYLQLRAGVCIDSSFAGVVPHGPTPELQNTSANGKQYDRSLQGATNSLVLNLNFIMDATAGFFPSWVDDFLRAQIGQQEWAISSFLLFCVSVPPALVDTMFVATKLIYEPIITWVDHIKPVLNILRRCPILACDIEVSPADVFSMRKLPNILMRLDGDADFTAERLAHESEWRVHFTLTPEWELRDSFTSDVFGKLQQIAPHIVEGCMRDTDAVTMKEWWSRRAQWAPGGSSSDRSSVGHLRNDSRVGGGERPNKKVVLVERPDDYWYECLTTTPRSLARSSTKREPGGKLRALWATDDLGFVVSSYASHNIEKYMAVEGIRVKQSPQDVVEWSLASFSTSGRSRWLSLDYSDYNKEHEADVLSCVGVALAQAWVHSGADPKVVDDKVIANLWVAESHQNKIAMCSELGEMWRVFGGLFSGDRDTARDNTILHAVYSGLAADAVRGIYPGFTLSARYYCGDDEDVLMRDWADAFFYFCAHGMMGFIIKPEKQMCSRVYHEFLQRIVGVATLPLRPLCAALGTVGSGQWYKDVHRWYDSLVQSVSDNIWELVTRGLDVVVGQRLAISMLDRLMVVSVGQRGEGADAGVGVKKLEWWIYRHGSSRHPLWYGTEGNIEVPPSIAAKVMPRYNRGYGIAAIHASRRRVLRDQHAFQIDVYDRLTTPDVYASAYVMERVKNHDAYARDTWLERYSKPVLTEEHYDVSVDFEKFKKILAAAGGDWRKPSHDEACSRMGVDSATVAACGGLLRFLNAATPKTIARFSEPATEVVKTNVYAGMDSAYRSWLANAVVVAGTQKIEKGNIRILKRWPWLYHLPGLDATPFLFFLAPNGAGKSTFIATHRSVIDFDDVIQSAMLQPQVHAMTKNALGMVQPTLTNTFQKVLMSAGVGGVTSQFPVWHWLENVTLSRPVKIILVLVPRDTIVERLVARGWSYEKSNRRYDRFMKTVVAPIANNHDDFSSYFSKHCLTLKMEERSEPDGAITHYQQGRIPVYHSFTDVDKSRI